MDNLHAVLQRMEWLVIALLKMAKLDSGSVEFKPEAVPAAELLASRGWLPTPQNRSKPVSKTLPGLANFYMVGQWVQPGGGLPPCVVHGREIIQLLCKLDENELSVG